MSHRLGTCGFLSLTLLCSSTLAAAPNDSARAAARRIGSEGLEAYDRGDFDMALDKLGRAYAVVRVPTVGLWSARAMVKKGLLVQASERYLEVARLELPKLDDRAQTKAQSDAARERAELLPRIPQLTILTPGLDLEKAEITLDGEPIASALIGVASPVNPGEHRIVLQVHGEQAWQLVTLKESESRQMTLRLPGDSTTATALSAEAGAAQAVGGATPRNEMKDDPDRTGRGRTVRTIGWVTAGVGGVGIITGTVAGILALDRKSQLDERGCVDGHCTSPQRSDVHGYRTMRTLSTVGFIVGGVGLATGVTLVLAAPHQQTTGSSVIGYVGFGSAGLAGNF